MPFGNVNVKYTPCKSAGQLKSAELYMLGKKREQIESGVVKTSSDLYTALGCNRDNFTSNILVTRKLHGKSYSRMKENNILAHKLSISFHPDDNDKMNYHTAFEIAQEFAERFMHSKGFEVLFAVHTDRQHIHVHFLIGNCNMNDGKSYRRNKRDLYEMSEFFGEQCLSRGLINSIRDEFYNHDPNKNRDRLTFAESQMRERGKESFKDELREVIQIELADPNNKCFDDVIKALWEHYNVEVRVAGNTVSYRHPEYKDKNGNLVSVRGSKLGELYTRKGIENATAHSNTRNEITGGQYAKSNNTATANGFIEGGNAALLAANDVGTGAKPARRRGQVSSNVIICDHESNLRGIDEFYERYSTRTTANEDRTDKNAAAARSVQRRNKGRGR